MLLCGITGGKGRPTVQISIEQLQLLHSQGFTAKQMSSMLHCSAQLVYKQLYEAGIHQRDKYCIIHSADLEAKVAELHKAFPNSGSKVITWVTLRFDRYLATVLYLLAVYFSATVCNFVPPHRVRYCTQSVQLAKQQ